MGYPATSRFNFVIIKLYSAGHYYYYFTFFSVKKYGMHTMFLLFWNNLVYGGYSHDGLLFMAI